MVIAQQELRSKREQELASLKKNLEEEAGHHEGQLADMRHKHSQEIGGINEQLETFKKARASLEKAKQTLEAENADLATELRNVNSSRQENDRRRKQAESQIAELQVKHVIPINSFFPFCQFFFLFIFTFILILSA